MATDELGQGSGQGAAHRPLLDERPADGHRLAPRASKQRLDRALRSGGYRSLIHGSQHLSLPYCRLNSHSRASVLVTSSAVTVIRLHISSRNLKSNYYDYLNYIK